MFLGLLFLLPHGLLRLNKANHLIPFTVYCLAVTYVFSPLGPAALLRCLGYYLVPLIIFRAVDNLYAVNRNSSVILYLFFSLYLVVNFLLIPIDSFYLVGRFRGLMGNPNGLGMLVLFIYGAMDLLAKLNPQRIDHRYSYVFKAIAILLIIISGSRTALVALIVYEFLYVFLRYKRLRIVIVLISSLLVTFVLYFDFNQLAISLGLAEQLRLDSLETGSGRTEVWAVAWEKILEQPLFGNGLQFNTYYIDQVATSLFGDNRPRHWNGVWSSYISLLMNVGFVGFSIFVIGIKKIIGSLRQNYFGWCFLAMVLIIGVTESWMAAPMNAFMPMFFMYFAILHNINKVRS
jgi:O-antigen ligase